MGSLGEKEKCSAGGASLCHNGKRNKNADSGTYIKGNMGKVPKMAAFGNFARGNLKTEKKYDIAYHVVIFFSKILAKKFFRKK